MCSDPLALKFYSETTGMPEHLLAMSREQFHPKEALSKDERSAIGALRGSLKFRTERVASI
jgi:hypothetical protein